MIYWPSFLAGSFDAWPMPVCAAERPFSGSRFHAKDSLFRRFPERFSLLGPCFRECRPNDRAGRVSHKICDLSSKTFTVDRVERMQRKHCPNDGVDQQPPCPLIFISIRLARILSAHERLRASDYRPWTFKNPFPANSHMNGLCFVLRNSGYDVRCFPALRNLSETLNKCANEIHEVFMIKKSP